MRSVMTFITTTALVVMVWVCLIDFNTLDPAVASAAARTRAKTNTTKKLNLVATTGQINSALLRITDGTETEIKLFCGPGVDPHSFSASTRDIQAMQDADAIFYNGFHLEARLTEYLHDAFADKSWAMSEGFPKESRVDWVEDGEIDPDAPFDPHIWNHLPGWAKCIEGLVSQLTAIDPSNATTYQTNGEAYVAEILETHQWAAQELKAIPSDRRVIVSAHDAFNYFANVYEMETLAVLGIGNNAEADIRTMRTVAKTICAKKIPVIFMEEIANPKVTQALKEACHARKWQVEIVDRPLYSDDLGEAEPNNTFIGAFRSNVTLIAESLQSRDIR